MSEKRRFEPGDAEPDDLKAVTDAYRAGWDRTETGWYPDEGGFHRQERSWWWLTMNRGPLEER